MARTAYRLGISSKLEPNASLSLGTSEVSLMELVSAYATFANSGLQVQPRVVDEVYNKQGKVLYKREPQNPSVVVEPRYVQMMNAMMQETLLIGTARKAELPGWQAAGKTGTTQDFRDAWFVGYTSRLVTGVWLGNDDASPTKKLTGSSLPIDIWNPVMRSAHQGIPVAGLPGIPDLSFASAIPPTDIGIPFGHEHPPRPQPSERNLDAWFFERLDRLLGRR